MAKKTVKQIKKELGHVKKGPTCANCLNFTSEFETKKSNYGEWTEEKNKRCNLGGFVTGKSNWCKFHVWKG